RLDARPCVWENRAAQDAFDQSQNFLDSLWPRSLQSPEGAGRELQDANGLEGRDIAVAHLAVLPHGSDECLARSRADRTALLAGEEMGEHVADVEHRMRDPDLVEVDDDHPVAIDDRLVVVEVSVVGGQLVVDASESVLQDTDDTLQPRF